MGLQAFVERKENAGLLAPLCVGNPIWRLPKAYRVTQSRIKTRFLTAAELMMASRQELRQSI